MTQSTVLAAGTTAASSTDIVVTTTPVSVSVFSSAGGQLPSGIALYLERQAPGPVWQPVYDDYRGNHEPVVLGQRRMDVGIFAPGTYRVRREAIPTAVGVALDTTA